MSEKEKQTITHNFFGSLEIDALLAQAEASSNPHESLFQLSELLNDTVFAGDKQRVVLAHGAFLVRYANNKHGFDPYQTTYGKLSGFRVTVDNKTPYLVADIVPFGAEFIPDDDEDRIMLSALLISNDVGFDNYSLTFDANADIMLPKIDKWSQAIKTALLESANVFNMLHEILVYEVFINEIRSASSELRDSESLTEISQKVIGDMMLYDVPAIEYVLAGYLDADEPAMAVICERSYESEHSDNITPPEISFRAQDGPHCVEGQFVGITIEPVEKTIANDVMVRPRPLLVLRDYGSGNLVQIPINAISEYNFGSDATHDELAPSQRPTLSSLEAIADELSDIDITSGD